MPTQNLPHLQLNETPPENLSPIGLGRELSPTPAPSIAPQIYELYDQYCHSGMPRREFLTRSSLLVAGGLAMAQALLPQYAKAQTISFTDPRIKANYVNYASPGGNSGQMRGYLVRPNREGQFPSVLVIHENRGLNPYIEDVARRLASVGFLALAPDGLSPVGGYPGNDDEGKEMQDKLDPNRLRQDMLNSAMYLKHHPLSTGKLGATGFCWGGSTTNFLAAELSDQLQGAAPYYGEPPKPEKIGQIKAALLLHFAQNDPRVTSQWANYDAALTAAKVSHQGFVYPETQHGFHNNSTPRYAKEAAELSWNRTIEFFKKELA
jgi:carboxymethylenebutenolidase